MDDTPEDWGEKERIKAEIRKAEDAGAPESKANLANFEPRDFATKKGFTREPEAIRQSGERLANASAVLAILGAIGSLVMSFVLHNIPGYGAEERAAKTALNIVQGLFETACIIAPILAIAGLVAAIIYKNETGKSVRHILITAGLAIIIVALKLLVLPHI